MVGARVALSAYTTLGLGGPAGRFFEASDDEQLVSAVREADQAGEPVLVLGGGSNLVVADEGFPGTVIRVASRGVTVSDDASGASRPANGEAVLVTVAAGEAWDRVVEWSVDEGLAGLECLSGIPGLAGATPIQNVGAYGQDVSQTITEVRALDRERGEVIRLTAAQCEFGYRTSMLKRVAAGKATGRFVVLGVTFRLWRAGPGLPPGPWPGLGLGRGTGTGTTGTGGQAAGRGRGLSAPVRYAELARRLGVEAGGRVPLEEARSAVLALRRGKGMVLDPGDPDTRSAGSFFTNPILSAAQFEALRRLVAQRLGPDTVVPHFPADDQPAGRDGEDRGAAENQPADRSPADRSPAERGPVERGPAERGPAEHDLAAGGPGEGAVKVPAAWLIERAGFAKGYPAGAAARISAKHTLALTNHGQGSTADLLALAIEIRAGVQAQFGINLSNEPVLVGVAL